MKSNSNYSTKFWRVIFKSS